MKVSRRRWFEALALGGAIQTPAPGQGTGLSIETLRQTSAVHGANLSDARLAVLQPALERRLSELRALRDLVIDDAVAPTPGGPVE